MVDSSYIIHLEQNRDIGGLITLLYSPDPVLRKDAVEALGRLRSHDAVEPVMGLLEDEVQFVRAAAAKSLGRIRNEKAVYALSDALKKNQNWVAEAICDSLGCIGTKDSVDALTASLSDPGCCHDAGDALAQIGGSYALSRLLESLESPSHVVKESALRALGKMGEKRAVNHIVRKLSEESGPVRVFAAKALGEIGDKRAVEPIISSLFYNDIGAEGFELARTLGKIGDESLATEIIPFLEYNGPFTRRMAMRVLAGLGDSTALKRVVEIYADENKADQKATLNALKGSLSEKSERRLLTLTENKDKKIKNASIAILTGLNSQIYAAHYLSKNLHGKVAYYIRVLSMKKAGIHYLQNLDLIKSDVITHLRRAGFTWNDVEMDKIWVKVAVEAARIGFTGTA